MMPARGARVTLARMGRDEDTLRPPPARPPQRAHIARIAVEHSKPIAREEPTSPDDEAIARMMSQLEGNLLAKVSDLLEERNSERPSRIQVEVAPPKVEKKHWLHSVGGTLTGIAAVLAGLTALTASSAALWAQLKPPPPVDYGPDVRALKRFQLLATQQFQMQAKYDPALRRELRGYFEAMGLKVPPAPGEPASDPAELLPAPLVDPHRVTKTSHVQAADPLPLPPALPSEFDPTKP